MSIFLRDSTYIYQNYRRPFLSGSIINSKFVNLIIDTIIPIYTFKMSMIIRLIPILSIPILYKMSLNHNSSGFWSFYTLILAEK